MAMLEIRGVRKSFHTYAKPGVRPGIFGRAPKPVSSLDVLRGVDLTVEKGDVVAILGPSGSGKTTLLRCLNFLETADAGTLTFDGEAFDLARADRASIARLRRKTAFVFQNYNLFRNKTALQNVTEGLIVARKMPKNEANAIGMKMLDFARKKLSEHEHPVLSVLNTNTRAIALYTRMGWEMTSGTELEFTPEQYPAVVKKCALVWMRYEGGAQK